MGWVLGPLLGGALIFGSGDPFAVMARPYMIISLVVFIMALVFIKTPLPVISNQVTTTGQQAQKGSYRDLPKHHLLVFAVVAQFFYVAAQTGIGSFFINYVIEVQPNVSHLEASRLLALGGMGLFMVGRMFGSYIMRAIPPKKLLSICAGVCVLLMIVVMLGLGVVSVVCLFCSYLFMSIMFPTIFALGISDMGDNRERASSILVMCVVGGALVPMFMGFIADFSSMTVAFVVPLICFIVIWLFGLSKVKN